MAAAAGGEEEGPSVLFLHPDLGLGGAERLVVDAALALQARGCRVQIWTAHYDAERCFAETRGLSVRRAGGWLPRSLWGRGQALCAALRMAFVALYIVLLSGEPVDAFVCDQVPGGRGGGAAAICGPAAAAGGEAGGEAGVLAGSGAPWGEKGAAAALGCPPGSPLMVGLGGRGCVGKSRGLVGPGPGGEWGGSRRPGRPR